MLTRLSPPSLTRVRALLIGLVVLAMALAGSAGCNWG